MNNFLFSPKIRVGFLVHISLMVFLSAKVCAEEPSHFWVNISPQIESKVFSYAPSPSHKEIVYAFSGGNSLLKSLDSGVTWKEVVKRGRGDINSINIDSPSSYQDISHVLRVDANDPQILYSASSEYGRLLKSFDGGVHWKELFEKQVIDTDSFISPTSFFLLNPQPITPLLKALLYTNQNGNREMRLLLSEDKGEHWIIADHIIQRINEYEMDIVGIDPLNPDIIYAASGSSSDEILYKSLDGGKSWNSTHHTDSSGYRGGLKIHPVNTDILYAQFRQPRNPSLFGVPISNAGYYDEYTRSEDGGKSWERLGNIEDPARFIGSLTLDPTDTNIIYADLREDIISENHSYTTLVSKSNDRGRSWMLIPMQGRVDASFDSGQGITIHPQDNQNLFYSSRLSPLVSFNGGEKWRNSPTLVRASEGNEGRIEVAEDDPNVMYSYRNNDNKIYKSTDAGFHWRKVSEKYECNDLAVNPKNNSNLLCKNYSFTEENTIENLYRSFDAGNTWELVLSFKTLKCKMGFLTPRCDELLRTKWLSYASDGKTIYYLQDNQLRKSVNNGDSWNNIITPFLIDKRGLIVILVDPRNANIIYTVDSKKSIYKSISGGLFWQKQLDMETIDHGFFHRLLMHPSYPDKLLFIYESFGRNFALISNNGGDNWVKLSKLFTDIFASVPGVDVAFNPVNPNGILAKFGSVKIFGYLGQYNLSPGLYETTNLGKTWNIVAEESANSIFTVADNIYSRQSNSRAIPHRLTSFKKVDSQNCVFTWAELNYPTLFGKASGGTHFIENYVYREYKNTNTYLGVFQDNNMHLLQANLTDEIRDVGFFDYFQSLSGCK